MVGGGWWWVCEGAGVRASDVTSGAELNERALCGPHATRVSPPPPTYSAPAPTNTALIADNYGK